jgi:hypothetical protein
MRACSWKKNSLGSWRLTKRGQTCSIAGSEGTGKNKFYRLDCMGYATNYYASLATAKARGCRRLANLNTKTGWKHD